MFSIYLSILGKVGTWAVSGLGTILLLILGWVVKEYLIPFLSTTRKKKLAEYILLIADEVTDYFVAKYPNVKWVEWINQAVDKIIEITGASKEVATRAAQAAVQRKQVVVK
jgi:phosphoglycerate dehydrogenase-like enzyme